MSEQKENTETTQNEEGQKQTGEQGKSQNQKNAFDAIMDSELGKKISSSLTSLLVGAAGGFGISYFFFNKKEEKMKQENEELKQSLYEMNKEFKKLKKKQRKLKEKYSETEEEKRLPFLNGTGSAEKENHRAMPGNIRNAYLD